MTLASWDFVADALTREDVLRAALTFAVDLEVRELRSRLLDTGLPIDDVEHACDMRRTAGKATIDRQLPQLMMHSMRKGAGLAAHFSSLRRSSHGWVG